MTMFDFDKNNKTYFFPATELPKASAACFSLSKPLSQYTVLPGLCDVHVHFREPGFSYKETIRTGSLAAAKGGYTAVCTMPNLEPVPDSLNTMELQRDIIRRDALIRVYPYAAITKGRKGTELSRMQELSEASVAFSDDGSGVQSEALMREAMVRAKALGKIIAAHCEDNSLLFGGCIHEGSFASSHGFKGISSESEYRQIERDLRLAEETGCRYHVCHISARQSVELIRQAKKRGVDVSCETAPHYLVLDDSDLTDEGRFKMNPPLRDREDRLALLEGIADGTVDMIATDHAPHSREEKSKGLSGSAFGIVGLETAFPVLYTHLVKKGIISLERLIELMAVAPRRRFGLPLGDDLCLWDLDSEYTVDPRDFLSKGKSTPFEGMKLYGKCVATLCNGKVVYSEKEN